jgi:hypothetical protein
VVPVLRLGAASYSLLFSHDRVAAPDIYMRWAEVRWIHAGISPPEAKRIVREAQAHPTPTVFQQYHHLQSIALVPEMEREPDRWMNGYPPSSYLTLALLFSWESLRAARVLFWAIDAVALIALGAWVWRAARDRGFWACFTIFVAVLGIYGLPNVIKIGTLSLFIALCLLVSLNLCRTRDSRLGGLIMGLALVKPTVTAPFLLPLAFKRRWAALAVAVGYNAVSAAVICWWTATSPLIWMKSLSASAATFAAEGVGLMKLLTMIPNANIGTVMNLIGPVSLLTAALVMLRFARLPMVCLFAAAAVTAVLSTYFKWYDFAIIPFLLVPLGAAAFCRQTPRLLVPFALLALALCLPNSTAYMNRHRSAQSENRAYALFANAAWISTCLVGLGVLLAENTSGQPGAPASTHDPR